MLRLYRKMKSLLIRADELDLTAILVMAPIAIASMMEHIGDMSAISATVGV